MSAPKTGTGVTPKGVEFTWVRGVDVYHSDRKIFDTVYYPSQWVPVHRVKLNGRYYEFKNISSPSEIGPLLDEALENENE